MSSASGRVPWSGSASVQTGSSPSVDPDGLEAQVAAFNSGAAEGRDTQFRRGERPWSRKSYGDPAAAGHPNLGTIVEPPFFAMRPDLVGTGIPTAGLDTDEAGRVLGGAGQPIGGLYAAGNSSAVLERAPATRAGSRTPGH